MASATSQEKGSEGAKAKGLLLFDTHTTAEVASVDQQGLDVFFPPEITWSDVLDCRIPPYDDRSVEENCAYAVGVRKAYILVTAENVSRSTPQLDAD